MKIAVTLLNVGGWKATGEVMKRTIIIDLTEEQQKMNLNL